MNIEEVEKAANCSSISLGMGLDLFYDSPINKSYTLNEENWMFIYNSHFNYIRDIRDLVFILIYHSVRAGH